MKNALRDGVISPESSVFDYGCGRGQDVQLLNALGIRCQGWDPAYFPEATRERADIVNLGYVVNVIESPEERDSTLREAWDLCRKALIVSAQILIAGRGLSHVEFGDGVLTTRNTFQRYYRQEELKTYIEQLLSREAVPAALGVFYVFRDETLGQDILSRRYRRRELVPPRELTLAQFDANRAILDPKQA